MLNSYSDKVHPSGVGHRGCLVIHDAQDYNAGLVDTEVRRVVACVATGPENIEFGEVLRGYRRYCDVDEGSPDDSGASGKNDREDLVKRTIRPPVGRIELHVDGQATFLRMPA